MRGFQLGEFSCIVSRFFFLRFGVRNPNVIQSFFLTTGSNCDAVRVKE